MRKDSLLIFLLLSLILIFVGCGREDGEDKNDTSTSITLNKQLISVDKSTTVGCIHIISGNGGYSIVLPKKISVGNKQIDFSNEILALSIDSASNIVAERKLLNDEMVSGEFMVTDCKGERELFVVNTLDVGGYLYDFDELEKHLLDNPDYWQK